LSSDDEAGGQQPFLTVDDFTNTRPRALDSVEVPANVLQLIADMRSYLQVRCLLLHVCVCE
jgi:hypothetical protein